MTGRILDIQKMSTEDGPGIRTTVFFKGCNLKCAWCHNPESIQPESRAVWVKARCIGCGSCVKACPNDALYFDENGAYADRDKCTNCLKCAESCPTSAMEQKGAEYSCESLTVELLKDRAYFEKSGGGITASGGEPLLQAEFVRELFKALLAEGVHTALDTAAYVPFRVMERVLEYSSLLLLDLKLADEMQHKQFTGASNTLILENAAKAAEYAAANNTDIWVRTPIIPGATDSEENIAAIGRFISRSMMGSVKRWELCAFNNLCRDKYERLGLKWKYKDAPLLTRADMDGLLRKAEESVGVSGLAVWTGAVQREHDLKGRCL